MSDRAPAHRDPSLHFDALRLVALLEGEIIENTSATERTKEKCLREHRRTYALPKSFSPLQARSVNWLDGPCLAPPALCIWGSDS